MYQYTYMHQYTYMYQYMYTYMHVLQISKTSCLLVKLFQGIKQVNMISRTTKRAVICTHQHVLVFTQ